MALATSPETQMTESRCTKTHQKIKEHGWIATGAILEGFCDFGGNAAFIATVMSMFKEGKQTGPFTLDKIIISSGLALIMSMGSSIAHLQLNFMNQTKIQAESTQERSLFQKFILFGDYLAHAGETAGVVNLEIFELMKNINYKPSTLFLALTTSGLSIWGGIAAWASVRTCVHASDTVYGVTSSHSHRHGHSHDHAHSQVSPTTEPAGEDTYLLNEDSAESVSAGFVARWKKIAEKADRWTKFTACTETLVGSLNGVTLWSSLLDLFISGKEASGYSIPALVVAFPMGLWTGISIGAIGNLMLNVNGQPGNTDASHEFEFEEGETFWELPLLEKILIMGTALGSVGDTLGVMNMLLLFIAESMSWEPSMFALGMATIAMALVSFAGAVSNTKTYHQTIAADYYRTSRTSRADFRSHLDDDNDHTTTQTLNLTL